MKSHTDEKEYIMGSVELVVGNMFDVFGDFIEAGINAVEGFWQAGTGSLQ